MAISCVYCGGEHTNASQVRECWQRSEGVEVAVGEPNLFDEPVTSSPPPATEPLEPRRPTPSRSRAESAVPGPGPDRLARTLVVGPGDDVPDPWAAVPVVIVDHAAWARPAAVVAELREHRRERRRVVVELHVDLPEAPVDDPPYRGHTRETSPLHELGPRHELLHDDLIHLVWSNAVDGRGGSFTWWLLDEAVRLGATPLPPGDLGDVALPDGTVAWLDGGPLTLHELGGAPGIDGTPVVHRVAIEHRRLVPLGSNALPDTGSAVELAPDQRAAVTHRGSAARIIAPAGSGKTRVLTERARHVVQRWGVPAAAVTLVAFNKRAQTEMAERSSDVRGLQVRTLNAIALAIVNGSAPFARRPVQYRTIDEPEVRRIIGKLVSFPRKRNADPIAPWIEALGLVRLGLREPREVESIYDGDIDGFTAFVPKYRRELESQRSLDFDEQVHRAIQILLEDPAARAAAQRVCRVLLVDEFQDLTPAHLLLVRLLAGPDGAVFGVGDDDQTIYGYNGADPAWLIDFVRLFPLAEEHPLEVNYRCPGDVVASADRLLRHNVRRVAKTIRSAHADAEGLAVSQAADTVDATVAVVRGAVANGRPPADVAVLTRVNSLLAPVQAALVGHGIPVTGGVGAEFVERTAVRSFLAWLHLGQGLWSGTDLQEALRRPSRPLHPSVATWVTEQLDLDGLHRLANRLTNDRDAQRVREFAHDIERVRDLVATGGGTADVVRLVRDSIGLGGAVQTLDQSRHGMNRASQSDDLTALEQLARQHSATAGFERWLRDTLARPWQSGGVTLATVHRVKGQEWPVVVVHHASADQFPHRLATDTEEERRLFHVAVTRCSQSVTVVPGSDPTPFVDELANEPPERPARIVSSNAPERRGTVKSAPPARTGNRAASGRSADKKPGEGLSPKAALAFQKLKELRRELAKGKPAYTVFDDATLERIALAQPSSLAELSALRGIGPAKLDQYGAAVLAVIEDVHDS